MVVNGVTAGRSYRTNIEILVDLLNAARTPIPKTRMIGMANLNRQSFEEYLRFCTEDDLILLTPGGYVATQRGNSLLEALVAVLAKATELESVAQRSRQNASSQPVPDGVTGAAMHYISRWAWNEIVLGGGNSSPARRSGGLARKGPRGVSDPEPLRAAALSLEGPLEEEARTSETCILTKDPSAEKGKRRNGVPSRPGR